MNSSIAGGDMEWTKGYSEDVYIMCNSMMNSSGSD